MKKSVVLSLAIIMCLFAVTGSIAYFTDSITVQNEVQSGTLHIEQFEFERVTGEDGNVTLQKFTQNQAIYPSVGTASHSATANSYEFSTTTKEGKPYAGTLSAKLMSDSLRGFVDKIVAVKNTGNLNVYVRTYVAVPTAFVKDDAVAVHLDWNQDNWIETEKPIWIVAAEPIQDIITVADHQIFDVPYTIYYATCTVDVAPGEVSHPGLLGFYLDSQVNHNGTHYTLDGKELGTSSELKILVASAASQVIPTGIGDEPRDNALDAMDKTYPASTSNPSQEATSETAPTVIYHPWRNP